MNIKLKLQLVIEKEKDSFIYLDSIEAEKIALCLINKKNNKKSYYEFTENNRKIIIQPIFSKSQFIQIELLSLTEKLIFHLTIEDKIKFIQKVSELVNINMKIN